jgi:hypothetical protein
MGQKMVCFEALRGTRSRQDESIEVGEVSGVETAVFGVQWGACRLVDWADFSVVGDQIVVIATK